MKNKKQKWEILFEEYSNGKLDKELTDLEDKHNNDSKNKMDTKDKGAMTKAYMSQKKKLEKIKENLPKIQNLIEFKVKVTTMKEKIDSELNNRKKISKLTEEQGKLDEENEKLLAKVDELKTKLKAKDISDDDRKTVQEELTKTNKKRTENNEKYGENGKELLEIGGKSSEFEKISKEDLEMMSNKLSIQLSKTNFYANRLIKGYNIESIRTSEKENDWKMKATGKEAKKMEELKSASKDDKQIEQMTEEQLAKNVKETINQEVKPEEKVEENSMVEVSEFEQKHPRLAKIKKFLTNIKDKVLSNIKKEEKEEQKEENEDIDKKEQKEKNENTEKDKQEKEVKEEAKLKIEKSVDKHKEFVKVLKNMDEYEIYDVAEKGLDGIKQEKMEEAKKKLQENKEKHAQGLTEEEKEER